MSVSAKEQKQINKAQKKAALQFQKLFTNKVFSSFSPAFLKLIQTKYNKKKNAATLCKYINQCCDAVDLAHTKKGYEKITPFLKVSLHGNNPMLIRQAMNACAKRENNQNYHKTPEGIINTLAQILKLLKMAELNFNRPIGGIKLADCLNTKLKDEAKQREVIRKHAQREKEREEKRLLKERKKQQQRQKSKRLQLLKKQKELEEQKEEKETLEQNPIQLQISRTIDTPTPPASDDEEMQGFVDINYSNSRPSNQPLKPPKIGIINENTEKQVKNEEKKESPVLIFSKKDLDLDINQKSQSPPPTQKPNDNLTNVNSTEIKRGHRKSHSQRRKG